MKDTKGTLSWLCRKCVTAMGQLLIHVHSSMRRPTLVWTLLPCRKPNSESDEELLTREQRHQKHVRQLTQRDFRPKELNTGVEVRRVKIDRVQSSSKPQPNHNHRTPQNELHGFLKRSSTKQLTTNPKTSRKRKYLKEISLNKHLKAKQTNKK